MQAADNYKHIDFLVNGGAATINDHVLMPSGKHATTSFTKYKLYPQLGKAAAVAREIAQQFIQDDVQVVIGAANGGSLLAQLVAIQFDKLGSEPVACYYAEQDVGGGLILKDAANRRAIRGQRVLMVDDTVRDGATADRLRGYLTSLGAKVIGLGVICVRNEESIQVGSDTKFYAYATFNDGRDSYPPNECPLCQEGIPLSTVFGFNTM